MLAAAAMLLLPSVRPLMIMMMERRLRGPINSFPRHRRSVSVCLYIPFILSVPPAPGEMTCSLSGPGRALPEQVDLDVVVGCWWMAAGEMLQSPYIRKVCVLTSIVSHSQKRASFLRSPTLTTCHNYNRPHPLTGTTLSSHKPGPGGRRVS